nr:hypothetical protein [Tanacetum cinerariifolium]
MLKNFPKLPGQKFEDPSFEKDILSFIRDLGHTGEIKVLSDVNVNHMHQPWRSVTTIINKYLSGKTTGHDSLRLSQAYMTYYAYATGEKTRKPKYVQKKADSETSPKKKLVQSPKGKRLKATAKVPKSGKKKLPAQGLETLLEIALSEAEQMKISTKRSMTQFHVSHASGLGAHEGTGLTPGVLDVPTYGFDDKQISWKFSDEEDDDDQDDDNDDDEDNEERHEEKQDEEEEDNVKEEKLDEDKTNEEEEVDEYSDVNINLERRDTEMTEASLANQSSSVSSGFISNMLNPNPDTGIDSILNLNTESTFLVDVPIITNLEMPPSSITTLPPPPIPIIQPQQQTPLLTPTLVPNTIIIKRYRDDEYDEEEPFVGSNRGSKRRRARKEPESTSEPKEKTSKPTAFVMNQLKVDTLTLELLASPTFKLMKGSCKSLVELEYFLEEVYKATIDQLNWNDPEGHQYPHDLRKPLPLIPNSQGRRVIPFNHFINNNLAYLWGGSSSRTYATSVTKTKAAYYGYIKWIEDLVPSTMWVRRDDEKIYTFKEGDYKRLHLQDIKDMLLLLVQGKLTNLTIEERLALNVSLQMFTRSIVIQRRVKDLQLGDESYQKKLNLTSPDTYRSDLKRLPTYSVYPNPRGFIYQNKDKKNKLIRIDELYKFSDGTLNDVRTVLDDILNRIRIKYLPQTYWRNVDKERAGAMIQAIDKQLKNRKIMRNLEKFVGGRPYEREFQLLERTI